MKEIVQKKITTKNSEETRLVGLELGKMLKGGETILMFGEAGAGKTVMTKGIAEALHITERVTSPTFQLKNQYQGRLKLHHLDMYRIADLDEAYESGVLEGIYGNEDIAVIEWAENVQGYFNFPHLRVRINYLGGQDREIIFSRVE